MSESIQVPLINSFDLGLIMRVNKGKIIGISWGEKTFNVCMVC